MALLARAAHTHTNKTHKTHNISGVEMAMANRQLRRSAAMHLNLYATRIKVN